MHESKNDNEAPQAKILRLNERNGYNIVSQMLYNILDNQSSIFFRGPLRFQGISGTFSGTLTISGFFQGFQGFQGSLATLLEFIIKYASGIILRRIARQQHNGDGK